MVLERNDVAENNRWDIGALYRDRSEWENEYSVVSEKLEKGGFYKRSLETPEALREFLEDLFAYRRLLDKLYTYARMAHDVDITEDEAKMRYGKVCALSYVFREQTSWVEPLLLQYSEETLDRLRSSELLVDYKIFLGKIFRLKPYTLGEKEERILALADKASDTARSAFGSLNNADLKFPGCLDEKGEMRELTHATYQVHLKSFDRTLRRNAFMNYHGTFGAYGNTFCNLLSGQIKQLAFHKAARGYRSCLETALYPDRIDCSVYTSLISSVRAHLPSLHQYIGLRKKIMGYDSLHYYDLNVPLVEGVDRLFSYDEAVDTVVRSLEIMGEEYCSVLKKGLTESRWVDLYENKGKRSGAYSGGCYDGMPYILMNYQGTFRDMTTLTHEAGHSMHTYYSNTHRSYQDADYSIFLAETASTFHEHLLFRYLFSRAESAREKAYLINQKIDDIRATLFRQTLFAEFELLLHEKVENDEPLTPDLLGNLYRKLTREYFGPDLFEDPEISCEWSRIPHFYSPFYVYQYATGIAASYELAKKVAEGEEKDREAYLRFLASGSSQDPVTTLKEAGVDMTRSGPIDSLLSDFAKYVRELEDIVL